MSYNLSHLVNISSLRWIATVTHTVWKRIPQTDKHSDQIDPKNKDVELSGKILYQKNETIQDEPSEACKLIPKVERSDANTKPPISEKKSATETSAYSLTNISQAIIWTLFMDVPFWTIKYCLFHPNTILMVLYAILPSHVWFRLFPRLLAFLR